jgi:hypothetical protein
VELTFIKRYSFQIVPRFFHVTSTIALNVEQNVEVNWHTLLYKAWNWKSSGSRNLSRLLNSTIVEQKRGIAVPWKCPKKGQKPPLFFALHFQFHKFFTPLVKPKIQNKNSL